MSQIQSWLDQHLAATTYDFLGVATNIAPAAAPKVIRWQYVAGNQSSAYQGIRLQVGRGIAGMVWRTARYQLDEDIFQDREKLIEYPIARLESLDAALGIPVIVSEEVVAIFLIGMRTSYHFTTAEIQQGLVWAKELSALWEAEHA